MENILMGWQIEREDFMNKYKMITICSLSIVCILILSLLLPLTTSANDEESIELKLHYEKSSVTVNIAVNSEIYTGVVCKYIEVDNILEYDDLSYQTKENGKTLNLNKLENDNYTTTIENVSKRYIVVYASIGNCSLCDYIDCKSDSQSTEQTETPKQNDGQAKNENTTTEPETPSQNENTTTEPETPSQNENTTTEPETPSQNENTTTGPEIPSQNENTATEPETPSQNENTTTEPEVPSQNEDTATKPETPSQDTSSETTNKKTSNRTVKNNTETPKVVDKDSINTDDFEEIQSIDKTKTASTSEANMPQTGENDTAKIAGIIVFSIIGMVSFYKYKESCKSESM
jgi:hypothetical protein